MKNFKAVTLLACTLSLVLAFELPLQAAAVIRGPYFQIVTHNSITIHWRTDTASESRVRYGTSPGSLTQFVDEPGGSVTDHAVKLSGLTPSTKYYYSVGTTAGPMEGDGPDYYFVTSPTVGTQKNTRIWVLGDPGQADSSQKAVRDAYYNFNGDDSADLVLTLGDNAYNDGTDSEYQVAIFENTYAYQTLLRHTPFWPGFGNHEAHTADSVSQTGPYYEIWNLPKNAEAGGVGSGTEAYYSFDYANIHFICLNTYDIPKDPGDPMLVWLESDLQSTNQDWIIAYFHYPPYSKGSHDSDSSGSQTKVRANINPILEQGGADLVLAGHSHGYERSFFLDSHYGYSDTLTSSMIKDGGSGREDGDGAYTKSGGGPVPHEGAVYIVAGSSSYASGSGTLDHAAMYLSHRLLGSLIIDVDGDKMDVKFLDDSQTVKDYFTIQKGSSVPTPPSITQEPADQTVDEGQTAIITVSAKGSSPLAYQWRRNGTDISGAAESSYTTPLLTRTDNGALYSVFVSNDFGAVTSQSATLTVIADTTAPSLVSAAGPTSTQVQVRFSESLDTASAETVSNYTMDQGVSVTGAVLSGSDTVILTSSQMTAGVNYTLTVNNVRDFIGNTISANSQASFVYTELKTTEVRVAAGSDDAEESSSGSMTLTSSDLELVNDGSDQTVGMRFEGVNVPKNAAVLNAYVQFTVDEIQSTATSLNIQGEATDNAGGFTTSSQNISSRSRTNASVSWDPVAWNTVGEAGADQRTPDLASVLQEIFNRPGWVSGNALSILVTGTGHRTADSYDGSPAGAPLLHIEYSGGGASSGTQPPAAPVGFSFRAK